MARFEIHKEISGRRRKQKISHSAYKIQNKNATPTFRSIRERVDFYISVVYENE